MRLLFFTRTGFQADPLFVYIYSHVAASWPDHSIIAYQAPMGRPLSARLRKIQRLGFLKSLELISSAPITAHFWRRDRAARDALIDALPRPVVDLAKVKVQVVHSVNGSDAMQAITESRADLMLQTGAGVLKRQTFSIPRLGTINMHHGIAPLIKGMQSPYWALYERRPEWLGATVHEIDDGIDTGSPLAYAPITAEPGEGYPELFARATQKGVRKMLDVLECLNRGERPRVPIPAGERVYRSTFSGWKHLTLHFRGD